MIYVFLGAWGLYQLFPRTYDSLPINDGIGWLFIINAAANIVWIFVWAYEYVKAAVFPMLVIWATLILIYARLSTNYQAPDGWLEYFCVNLGWSLYLAWINAATFLNIYSAATNLEEQYLPASIAGLISVTLLEAAIALYRPDGAVSAVGTWALAAVAFNKKQHGNQTIVYVAGACAIFLGVLSIGIWIFLAIRVVRRQRVSWKVDHKLVPQAETSQLDGKDGKDSSAAV